MPALLEYEPPRTLHKTDDWRRQEHYRELQEKSIEIIARRDEALKPLQERALEINNKALKEYEQLMEYLRKKYKFSFV